MKLQLMCLAELSRMLLFLSHRFPTVKLRSILLNSLLLKRRNCKGKPEALHQREYNTNKKQLQQYNKTKAPVEKWGQLFICLWEDCAYI